MLSKRSSQKSHSGQRNSKNYMNYISYESRESQHTAKYSLNPDINPTTPIQTHPQETEQPINRDAYLYPNSNDSVLYRNGSKKGILPHRNSQEHTKTKREALKNTPKHNSFSTKGIHLSGQRMLERSSEQFYTHSSDNFYRQPPEKNHRQPQVVPYGSPNFSRTADIGAVMRNNEPNLVTKLSKEGQLLKQRLQYLQTLEKSIADFERIQDVQILRVLSRQNRLLLVRGLEEVNKLKHSINRKSYGDSVTESDNTSEDGMSTGEQSDRSGSVRIQQEKVGINVGISRSRERSLDKENELSAQNKINQNLHAEYQEQLRKRNSKQSELTKLDQQIERVQEQSQTLKRQQVEVSKKLSKLPFYREWNLMCKEAEGAKKTKVKLEQQIQKRSEKIKLLKSGGVSENQSEKQDEPQAPDSRRQRSLERANSSQRGLRKERSSSRTKLSGYRTGGRASEGANGASDNTLKVPLPLPLPRPHSMNMSTK